MSRLLQLRFAILAASSLLVCFPAISAAQSSAPERTQASSGSYRIAGTVVSTTGGYPLAGARVLIADTRNRRNIQSLLTSEDGRFEFQVNQGKYALQAAKRGFITSAYDQHDQFSTAIATGPDLATGNLILRLAPAAVLAGKVFDESGDPVRHASVSVYRLDRFSGVTRIGLFRRASTDDQGAYEVTPLDGGTYFVSVSAKPWYAVHPASSQPGSGTPPSQVDRSLDVAYPVTYYADATEADDATPIPIKGGDHIEVDIHLNPIPALHLLFHVADDGTNGFTVPQLQKPDFDGMDSVQTGEVQNVSPGVYEMTGLAPGRYAVRMPGSANDYMKEPTEIDLTRDGQELDAPSSDPASSVKATVQLLGGAPLPSPLTVELRTAKEKIPMTAEVDAKGGVTFQNVVAGKYDVLAGTPTKAYAVVRIASQGGDTAGHALNVPAGSSLAVSLVLTEGAVTVEGFAKRSGKPVAGAMVVLVPKDPEANHDFFRRDQSDLDGSFSLQSVIPGSYTIIAIENAWDLDWAKPAVLAHYCQHGQSVIIGDQSKGSMTLPNPLEVQPR
ncbi:MAG: carboxypeptidase-like regulatory domain-containing protein [Candidatus Korobacteraceae bacterium]